MAQGGNAADGTSFAGRVKLTASYDSFVAMCGDYQCLSLWYRRGEVSAMAVADMQGGFMLVRFNNQDGSHGYEMIDFRETMPALGNETVCSQTMGTQLTVRCTLSMVSIRLNLLLAVLQSEFQEK